MRTLTGNAVRFAGVLMLLVALAGVHPLPTARADDQVVTNTNDGGAGSLRQAITDVHEGGTITFDLTYPATITLASQLVVDQSLTIEGPGAGSLVISGNDLSRVFNVTSGTVEISGLTVSAGRATGTPAHGGGIRNVATLTLRQTSVVANSAVAAPPWPAGGGGIINLGDLTLEECSVLDNEALVETDTPTAGGALAIGGGILNMSGSSLTIRNSAIEGNLARAGDGNDSGGTATGGGIYNAANALLSIEASNVLSNTSRAGDVLDAGGIPGEGRGGGIFNGGTLAVELATTLQGNTAQGGDAGEGGYERGGRAIGGGLYNDEAGVATLNGVTLSGNQALGGTGDGDGGHAEGGGIKSEGWITLQSTTLAGNSAQGGAGQSRGGSASGGGIFMTCVSTVKGSTLPGNTAGSYNGPPAGLARGGGIHADVAPSATLEGVILSLNRAQGGHGEGGGEFEGGGSASGGGISLRCGTLTVTHSILTGNSAEGGSGLVDGGEARGGAIISGGVTTTTLQGVLLGLNTVQGGEGGAGQAGSAWGGGIAGELARVFATNCTFSGNQARSSYWAAGGGLYSKMGSGTLSFCTIVDNEADGAGGGIYSASTWDDSGPVLKNTIVGGNAAPTGPDIYQNVQSRGWNLVEDISGGTLDTAGGDNTSEGNITGLDPRLGPLQDNGGVQAGPPGSEEALLTHAPAGGPNPSLAIDAGTATDIEGNTVAADQRGYERPFPPGGEHDIGAHERHAVDLTLVKEATPTEAHPGDLVTFTLTLSNTGQERATGVVLTDPLPAGITQPAVVSSTLTMTDTGASPPFVWQVEDLMPGHGGLVVLSGVLSPTLGATTLTNTASIAAAEVDANPDDNQDSASVLVVVENYSVYLPVVLRSK